jgi:glycosyltransferase involved in cell wall biosynthesis
MMGDHASHLPHSAEPMRGRVTAGESRRVAVLIPCLNEELTVATVIASFRRELPLATIYVFDNRSTDRTAELARAAGAVVVSEPRPGKGHVIQSMFRYVDADVFVMVDGDDTYPARDVHALLEPILRGEADMVVGSRLHQQADSQFKSLNRWGNRLFLYVVRLVFGVRITDMLSGYRAFSRTFVKRLPLLRGGFETETELTLKALDRGFRIAEVPVNLVPRPEGSFSKIRISSDGFRIIGTIFGMLRDYKPLTFFGGMGLAIGALGLIPGLIVIVEFVETRYVTHVPSAILAVGMELSAFLLVAVGLVLHTVVRHAQELDVRLRLMTDELRGMRSTGAPSERSRHDHLTSVDFDDASSRSRFPGDGSSSMKPSGPPSDVP